MDIRDHWRLWYRLTFSYWGYINEIKEKTQIHAEQINKLLGFEIENPRTKEIPGMDWIKNESTANQMDIRDDRINLFVDAGSRPETYYYAVRAVSPGTYVMGPVMADAMYNGEYHSYNGGGVIKIVEK